MHGRMFALSLLLMSSPAFAAESNPQAPMDPQQRDRILREIEDLRARIDGLESQLGVTPPQTQTQAQPPAVVPAAKPSSGADDHSLELYGFAQVDVVQDFNRVDPNWDATLRPSKIPTTEGQFGSDGQSVVSVRQSRLGVKANGEVGGQDYEAKFEFDLYGVGVDAGQTTFRLRHAYGRWGPILAGQTNSLFMDGDLFPNVIDYWGPAGMVFVRTPQVRVTFTNKSGWTFAAALEHPSDDIDPGNIRLIDPDIAAGLQANEEIPDLTAMIRYDGDWGHVQLSGIARKIGYDTAGDPNGPSGAEFGWGLNLGTVFKWSLATFRLGGVYGEGIASYMNDGGMDLAPKAALVPTPGIFPPPPPVLQAKAVPLWGVTAYVDLQWSPKWSSSLGYSRTQVDNTNFQAPEAFHSGEYASGNILWTPIDRVLTGLELLWGKRTDNDGANGDDIRAQFSVKVSFSSKDLWGQ